MVQEKRKDDIIYLVKYLSKIIDADFDKRLSEYDLTAQQGRILFFINRETCCHNKEVHQNDIENEYHLSKSTVSGIVKRLEKKGIISIEKKHPFAILKPTQKGTDIICHLHTNRDRAIEQLLKDVDETHKQELLELLNKLIENMEGGN